MILRSLLRWSLIGCLAIVATESQVGAQDKVTDVKELAGRYKGYVVGDRGARFDNLTMIIKEDGSYTTTSMQPGTTAIGGQITVGADGKMNYASSRTAGTVVKKGDTLRFDGSGSRGSGYSEWERTK